MNQTRTAPPLATGKRQRLESLDALRGIIMILMALDHSRDFFSNAHAHFNPNNVLDTTPAFFFTRWITNFCAPVFSFLAGTGVFFAARSRTKPQLVKLLVTRGLWLIVLELTVLRVSWYFNFDFSVLKMGVLWCLGWSMIALAALVHLPRRVLLGVSLAIVLGHNLLDAISPSQLGSLSWLWTLVHGKGSFTLPGGLTILVVYPLIPWIGVMSAGYCFGEVFEYGSETRRRSILALGAALTLGFLVLRGVNMYGDPLPWAAGQTWLSTLMSFLACEKYPPSVSYLLMTMGPSLLLLWVLDRKHLPEWLNPTLVYGRVPFLFYVLHIPLLHAMGVAWADRMFGETAPGCSPILRATSCAPRSSLGTCP